MALVRAGHAQLSVGFAQHPTGINFGGMTRNNYILKERNGKYSAFDRLPRVSCWLHQSGGGENKQLAMDWEYVHK